jgi:hypothetical protein
MGKPTVQREVCIPQGNEGQEGRLDLVIRYGGQAIIVVEVKKGDAEGADTTKQEGYSKWIDKQPEAARYPVMLVTSADDEICKGFVSLPWANVCIELRRLSIEIIHERRVTTAAMILAFVAAVEQNLLGFSYETVQRISEEEGLLFNVEVVDYVEKFVNRMEE